MKTGKRALLVLFTLLLCVACDQVTKELAKTHLPKNKGVFPARVHGAEFFQ